MNDKELDLLQKDLLKNLSDEEETEKEISIMTDEITSSLYNNGSVKAYSINNKNYSFRFSAGNTKDELVVVVVDNLAFKITDGKKGIFTARSNIEEGYTAYQCLRCIIEAFIRHVTGNFKPDMIEE